MLFLVRFRGFILYRMGMIISIPLSIQRDEEVWVDHSVELFHLEILRNKWESFIKHHCCALLLHPFPQLSFYTPIKHKSKYPIENNIGLEETWAWLFFLTWSPNFAWILLVMGAYCPQLHGSQLHGRALSFPHEAKISLLVIVAFGSQPWRSEASLSKYYSFSTGQHLKYLKAALRATFHYFLLPHGIGADLWEHEKLFTVTCNISISEGRNKHGTICHPLTVLFFQVK